MMIQPKRILWKIRHRWFRLNWWLSWLLEDRAHDGLGGPPNNFRHSPHYQSCGYGMSAGVDYFTIWFGNDAGDIQIWRQYQEGEGRGHWEVMMSARDFRKLALWYLWRWAWGEWFGLRRKLFYKRLHRQVKNMRKPYIESR